MSQPKFDLNVKSTIIRGEPGKGLVAVEAANANQMNRITGFLLDGTKVVVAQRPGRGGMDFNKLMSGKILAVAADGLSPVYEKNEKGEVTTKQKTEDGMPLYSSSGFYLLSSREFTALDVFPAYSKLLDEGRQILLMTEKQLANKSSYELGSVADLDFLLEDMESALDDAHNLVARHDEAMNKKRQRVITRAAEDAEAAGLKFDGVAFTECTVSPKDGLPFLQCAWYVDPEELESATLIRQVDESDTIVPAVRVLTAKETVELFCQSIEYIQMVDALKAGQSVTFCFVQGNLMRTSVSFRRKAENLLSQESAALYGDAVYLHTALNGWTKGLIAIMHSSHPNFPVKDYSAHHYVAAPRQAEIGMNRKPGGGWLPPEGVNYSLASLLAL